MIKSTKMEIKANQAIFKTPNKKLILKIKFQEDRDQLRRHDFKIIIIRKNKFNKLDKIKIVYIQAVDNSNKSNKMIQSQTLVELKLENPIF